MVIVKIEMRRKELGPLANEGARQAWLELARREWDQARLRAEIRSQTGKTISSGSLVKYLYCDRRPGVLWTEAFQQVLGVDPGLWYRDPVEPFLPPAATEAA
jgi:hypothetical protein